MIKKKYKLTDETIKIDGITLYRIRALKDFDDVKEGDLGGFVESEWNLSHDDNCWVGGNACIYQNAYISENAKVYDDAEVYGSARIKHNAHVYGFAEVYGMATVSG
ncbi:MULTISPECIES: hypothetical protein, partial [unclassified Bartonella]